MNNALNFSIPASLVAYGGLKRDVLVDLIDREGDSATRMGKYNIPTNLLGGK